MKKIFIFLFLFLLNYSFVSAYEINVKRDGTDNATYTTSLQNITNNGTVLNFKLFDLLIGSNSGEYKVIFPAGFSKIDYNILDTNTCNGLNIIKFEDNFLSYEVNPTNQNCVSVLEFNYSVTQNTQANNEIISVLDGNNNILQSINLEIIGGNTINKAETIDSNNNGFIDSYKLIFLTGGLANFSNQNLKVGTLTPTLSSINNNEVILNFTDGFYSTGEIPDITDNDGNIFSGISEIKFDSIGENDKSNPVILNINGDNTLSGITSKRIDVNKSIEIGFSENILETSAFNYFKVFENSADITNNGTIKLNTTNGNTILFCNGGFDINGDCTTNFKTQTNYTVSLFSNIEDWNGNKLSQQKDYNYSFGCAIPSVANGVVGVFPTCEITCNSGYKKSGNSCIRISTGGGGGGGGNNSGGGTSGGGGGGGGGGGFIEQDYEGLGSITNSENKLETIKNSTKKIIGYLNLKYNKNVTGDNGVIRLRTNLKSKSNIIIGENTVFSGTGEKLYGPFTYNLITDFKKKFIKINSKDFRSSNVNKLFFIGDIKNNNININKNIEVELNLGKKYDGNYNVYYSKNIDGNFKLIKNNLKDKNGIISFEINKFGYFAIIKDIYIDRINDSNIIIDDQLSFNEFKNNLINKTENTKLVSYINKYSFVIESSKIEEYIKFNSELKNKYNNYLYNLENLISNLDNITLENKAEKIKLIKNNLAFLDSNNFENLENIYITKEIRNNKVIYRTKTEKYKAKLQVFENTIFKKLDRLLSTKTISETTYNKALENYNNFILYLTIYKKYKYKKAAYTALDYGNVFVKIYKLKVKKITIIPELKKDLVKDIYPINRTSLKVGDYNPDVQNLQKVLENYGYFTYPQTTQYFGTVTNSSFSNFAREILNVEYNGIVTSEMINKINNLEIK